MHALGLRHLTRVSLLTIWLRGPWCDALVAETGVDLLIGTDP